MATEKAKAETMVLGPCCIVTWRSKFRKPVSDKIEKEHSIFSFCTCLYWNTMLQIPKCAFMIRFYYSDNCIVRINSSVIHTFVVLIFSDLNSGRIENLSEILLCENLHENLLP